MYLDVTPSRMVLTKALGRVSRAAYFGPTSPLHLVEMPDPPLPASDWVRVRNRMCGICGSDLHQLFLDAGLDVAPTALPAHKRIYLGHEMVGKVVEIGDAAGLQVGDRVVRWGRADDCATRGRKELCPACQRGHRVLCEIASEPKPYEPIGGGFGDSFITPAASLVRVPDRVTDAQAIFTEPTAVAIHAAFRRIPRPGEQALVLGVGTIGFLLIQVLAALEPECEITALAQFDWQAELARQLGARHVFLTGEDGYERVAELTRGRLYEGAFGNRMVMGGFDVVFDVVGVEATVNNALRWTRQRGAVVVVGVHLHRMKLDITPVWYQEVDLIGAIGHDIVTWQGERVSTFDLALRWMAEGRIRTAPLLTHRFPLEAYRQAFATALDKRRHRSIKVAFELRA
ncbi:MAG: zinc-binding dehydrogenase [Chloroflexi bacterium]|nr:zinc-binding dehydrogenase [Chloroflexota bacterium]